MVHPSEEIATYYGKFLFCDDVTEAYHSSLASAEQRHLLKNCGIVCRIGKHFFGAVSQFPNGRVVLALWCSGILARL